MTEINNIPVSDWYIASERGDGSIQIGGPLTPQELTKNLHTAIKNGEPTAVTRASTVGSAMLHLVSDLNEKQKPIRLISNKT